MSLAKRTILRESTKWHKWLGWTGGLALLIFALSGISHPVMTWFGPKAVAFFPPQTVIEAQHVKAIPEILKAARIDSAKMVKIVPSAQGPVLQVTETDREPRRYFHLKTYRELPDYDRVQGRWLAAYYTGLPDQSIRSIKLQTEFDAAYPWVNRLLPVYRVEYDTDDQRIAFVYTELGALAGMTNDTKTMIQSFFRAFHTWEWAEEMENARVFLMMVLLLSLFGMAATGTALVFVLKNRTMPAKRKWHRIASYVVWVPLLLFTASGVYHLLHYAYGDSHKGLKLGQSLTLDPEKFSTDFEWLSPHQGRLLNGISLTSGPDGATLYRLSIPHGRHGQTISKERHFHGTPVEKPALYFNAETGQGLEISDRDIVLVHGEKQFGFPKEKVIDTKLITHFGMGYDFRNKRLPVWQITYDTELGDRLYIDPATGMMVDRLVDTERYEGYSFSNLHKWNFLAPLTGRPVRDVLIVIVLCIAIFSTILGYIMLWPKRRQNAGQEDVRVSPAE